MMGCEMTAEHMSLTPLWDRQINKNSRLHHLALITTSDGILSLLQLVSFTVPVPTVVWREGRGEEGGRGGERGGEGWRGREGRDGEGGKGRRGRRSSSHPVTPFSHCLPLSVTVAGRKLHTFGRQRRRPPEPPQCLRQVQR